VRFVIRFEILDVDRLREMARAVVAVSRDEQGTVVFDQYVDEVAGLGTLYEAYASVEVLRPHGSGAAFTELAPRWPHPICGSALVAGTRIRAECAAHNARTEHGNALSQSCRSDVRHAARYIVLHREWSREFCRVLPQYSGAEQGQTRAISPS
jgi:quinol monooxygenase YgiN